MLGLPSHYAFVQIGAHLGLEAMPFAQEGKQCLIVEPVPYLNRLIVERYKDYPNVNISVEAISKKSGESDFFFIEKTQGMPDYASQIGSFSREHLVTLGEQDHFPDDFINKIHTLRVKKITINDLFARYGIKSIESLLIDTEGFDGQILMSVDFDAVQIDEIIFERKHLDGVRKTGYRYNELVSKLNSFGYDVVKLDRQNCKASLRHDWNIVRRRSIEHSKEFFYKIDQAARKMSLVSCKNSGVILLAMGEDYLRDALVSATTVKLNNPELPITIFSDAISANLNDYPFEFVKISGDISPFKIKVDAMIRSPYERTLFIDADTFVFGSFKGVFQILNDYDIAIGHGPKFEYSDGEYIFREFSNKHTYNTGVIAFNKSSQVTKMLNFWRSSMQQQDDSVVSAGIYCDQYYFNQVVKKTDVFQNLRVEVFDNTKYNLRCYALGEALKQFPKSHIVILHGKPWEALRFWGIDIYELVYDQLKDFCK